MPRSRYKQLVDAYAADIRAGRMPPGTRLPTHRELARKERLALGTATRVYAELEAMGLVSGEAGRGTFVREMGLPPGASVQHMGAVGDLVELNFNYPSLPGQAGLLRGALRQLAASGDLEALLRYQPHAGRTHERAAVARHLTRRGLDVDGEQVLIVSGAQHGLAVTMMALLRPGDVVAVDALTYPGFKVLAQTLHLELAPVPVTERGPDLKALETLCKARPVRAVYAMPTMHNPLGCVIDDDARLALVAIARRHGLLLLEDAAYAFLAESPPPPLAALAPDITVYISGLSKSVATGLRVGFVAAPRQYVAAIERTVRVTTWNTAGVMTAIASQWLDDGTVDRLEEEKRRDAMARQAIAREVLAGMPCVGHAASYFVWLPLPEDVRAEQVAMDLVREGVAVSTGESFATTAHVPHALRLALGSIDIPNLAAALGTVKRIIGTYDFTR